MKIRDFSLFADENMLRGSVAFLREMGFDVKFVREEQDLIGKRDIDLMPIAFQENRVIVKQDGDFVSAKAKFPFQVPGSGHFSFGIRCDA